MMNRSTLQTSLSLTCTLLALAGCEFPEGHTANMRFDDGRTPTVELVPTGARESDVSRPRSDREAVLDVIRNQAESWNRGNLEGFMDGYARSDKITFSGTKGTIHGYDIVLDRYRRDYPNAAAMGRVEFSNLDVTMMGPDAAVVLGSWDLRRADQSVGGVFTLVFRKVREGWKIVHDHTSRR